MPDGVDSTFEPVSKHYIGSHISLIERPLRTLKFKDAFAVLDSYGDIGIEPESPEGLYLSDTRYLSNFELEFEGRRPLLLGSVVDDDNVSLTATLTNPDIYRGDNIIMPRDMISIERTKLLFEGTCYERIALFNYDSRHWAFKISIRFDADFKDLFEVRGTRRQARGTRTVRVCDPQRVELRYDGLDGIARYTVVSFDPAPDVIRTTDAYFDVVLKPGKRYVLLVSVGCTENSAHVPLHFLAAYRKTRNGLKALTKSIATIESSNALFNEMACRSTSDIYMLVSRTPSGLYPYAGIPWFSTVFGRDGIITAMMMLWIDPSIAKGVLVFLAASQAKNFDPSADAQPGKILHEMRQGEMAHLKEVPFGCYYGTVDATPLFVMLAGLYFERTGDRKTLQEIWPNIEAALRWCDTSGDRDGDGFVEYDRETESGLANQGWKDSQDSIFHADGSDAKGPIALCEVQGYVYAAKRAAAALASKFGQQAIAIRLETEASILRQKFHDAFWCEEIGTYALALDGNKRPCRVRSSNAGHALFTGIADETCAARIAGVLTSPEAFSGWGIRTLSKGEPRYNPMSYHNGSVWPHDNALIVLGFARYGLKSYAVKVFSGMFDAASYQELRRLPELFCGFERRPRRGPTAYPVACAPQAWASAAPFALVTACLGLQLRHDTNEISFTDPRMPAFLDDLTIRGLQLGDSRTDVRLKRDGDDITVTVLNRTGTARIIQIK
jgi:glycogen debranching enzyme